MIWLVCILGVLLVASLLHIYMKKREVRNLNLTLLKIVGTQTNSRLTTATSCKNTAAFVTSVNELLQQNQEIVLATTRQEANLKRAITNISHDLRTPLTAARGYLQMLESQTLDAETTVKYLQVVQERLDTQTKLMNSLFEFANILEGDTTLNIKPVDICNIVRDVLSAHYEELRNFAVDVVMPNTAIMYNCDTAATERILHNLIKNAYTHGCDVLQVRVSDNAIEITNRVVEQGKLDASQLFDRFYTADSSRTGKSTGLGLAIVKELATQMGWQVAACVDGDMLTVKLFV